MSAANIAAALGAAYISGDWWRSRCPIHQGEGPTLALKDGNWGLVVHCHAGCYRDDVLDELRRRGLLDGNTASLVTVDPAQIERERQQQSRRRLKRIGDALDFWRNETALATGTVVARYWAARGLGDLPIPATIRASSSWLRHPTGAMRPGMVALVEHVEHGPVAIHRTWLQTDGQAKASVIPPRLSLGPVGGAAIRLADAGQALVVGEDVETVASVMVSTGLPGWSAISAGGIEELVLPRLPLAGTVLIAADHDRNGRGEIAAQNAARRWLSEGRRVRIVVPDQVGCDWNDVLLGRDMEVSHAA